MTGLATFMATGTALAAAAPCDWTRVEHLRPGQSIDIQTTDGRHLSGRLITANGSRVAVDVDGSIQDVAREQVAELRTKFTGRGKAASLLLAAGGGLVLGNAAARDPEAGPGPAWFAGMPLAVAGGLMLRHERQRSGLVYRRP